MNELSRDEVYTATIEFRSTGDSTFVQPTFTYSHDFSENYVENGVLPASYLALRDIGIVLRMMMHRNAATVTDEELDAMSEEDRAQAIKDAISGAKEVAKVSAPNNKE